MLGIASCCTFLGALRRRKPEGLRRYSKAAEPGFSRVCMPYRLRRARSPGGVTEITPKSYRGVTPYFRRIFSLASLCEAHSSFDWDRKPIHPAAILKAA